jgi:hypothetical protein
MPGCIWTSSSLSSYMASSVGAVVLCSWDTYHRQDERPGHNVARLQSVRGLLEWLEQVLDLGHARTFTPHPSTCARCRRSHPAGCPHTAVGAPSSPRCRSKRPVLLATRGTPGVFVQHTMDRRWEPAGPVPWDVWGIRFDCT